MDVQPSANRPYRSHKFPACDRCRARKIRCNFDASDGQKCLLCREKGWTCQSSPASGGAAGKRARSSTAVETRPAAKRRTQEISNDDNHNPYVPSDETQSGSAYAPRASDSHPLHLHARSASYGGPSSRRRSHDSPPAEASIIVGPVDAEDIQILEKYLTKEQSYSKPSPQYNTIAKSPGNPILYLSVPKRREGLKLEKNPGTSQKEILEQILGPFRDDLVSLYFEHIHPYFPVVDEDAVLDLLRGAGNKVSPVLLCDLYASALPLWSRSNRLKHHPRPDIPYFWNLAVAALQDDFMAPSISTIQCSAVDMIGRPVYSIMWNIVNEGRTVALAHSFGLNRDPRAWKSSDHEKSLRIRAWWAVLVNAFWSSYAHGVPPKMARSYFDVPLPSVQNLLTEGKNSPDRVKAAESFISLCTLSMVLGDILPIAYDLRSGQKDLQRELRRLECALDEWETSLPEHLQLGSNVAFSRVSASCNLRFCYLSIKVLLCRIALRAESGAQQASNEEVRTYRLAMLRASAQAIADFVASLSDSQLQEFWLPYTAHLLASSAMILLRCTIETTDRSISESCKKSLSSLQSRLRVAKEQQEWDLADIFLGQCDEPISRVTAADALVHQFNSLQDDPSSAATASMLAPNGTAAGNMVSGAEAADLQQNLEYLHGFAPAQDLYFPVENLGYPYETLWSMFDYPDMTTF